jgi:hypothetical protein
VLSGLQTRWIARTDWAVEANRELPTTRDERRLQRHTERLVRAYFAAVHAHGCLMDCPEVSPSPTTVPPRALLPPYMGIATAFVVAAAHTAGLLTLDPVEGVPALGLSVAVVAGVLVPAVLAGRVAAQLALSEVDSPPTTTAGMWAAPLLVSTCILSGAIGSLYARASGWIGPALLALCPLAVAAVEAAAAHPHDRLDRRSARHHHRAFRRRTHAEHAVLQAMVRWGTAHRDLGRVIDRVRADGHDAVRAAPSDETVDHHDGMPESTATLPLPGATSPLRLSLDVFAALPPSRVLAADLARRLRQDAE